MAKSIISDYKECYFCQTTYNLHKHHIFGGANRKKSEHYGLWVYLCEGHHNMDLKEGVHYNKKRDKELKQLAQSIFESKYSHEEFMEEFGKNYLD